MAYEDDARADALQMLQAVIPDPKDPKGWDGSLMLPLLNCISHEWPGTRPAAVLAHAFEKHGIDQDIWKCLIAERKRGPGSMKTKATYAALEELYPAGLPDAAPNAHIVTEIRLHLTKSMNLTPSTDTIADCVREYRKRAILHALKPDHEDAP